MSEEFIGILKLAFALISSKYCTYGAEKLQDCSFAEQKFRIIHELNLLDASAETDKDLSASIDFLKRGVEHLQMSFDESVKSGNPCKSDLPDDGKQTQNTGNIGTSSTKTNSAQKSVNVEDETAHSDAICTLKIESSKRFEFAKESFRKAEEKAADAFHNGALSTEERIVASRIGIASEILEHLDDPEIAVSGCFQYLRELHNMPAIKNTFSQRREYFRTFSKKAIKETVRMINLILADFISKFTKQRMAVFDWPMIECITRVLHPIYLETRSARKLEEMEITLPWDKLVYKEPILLVNVSINSKGDMIGICGDNHLRKFDKVIGEWQPFCLYGSPKFTIQLWKSLAIDDNDMVYILGCEDHLSVPITLTVCSTDGEIIRHYSLDFVETRVLYYITVTKDKKVIICSGLFWYHTIYVCDSKGKLMRRFHTDDNGEKFQYANWKADFEGVYTSHCDETGDNEIIVVTKSLPSKYIFHVYTEKGELRKTVDISRECCRGLLGLGVNITFSHATKNFITCWYRDGEMRVNCISETGELRNTFFLQKSRPVLSDDECPGDQFPDSIKRFRAGSMRSGGDEMSRSTLGQHLISHSSGVIALATGNVVFYLQSSQM